MVATTLATHGAAIIKDSSAKFNVRTEILNGSATVTPNGPSDLHGWVAFPIQSPPVDKPTLSNIKVNFTTYGASVSELQLWSANKPETSNFTALQERGSFEKSINTSFEGNGLLLGIKIAFDNLNGSITFQSVAISA